MAALWFFIRSNVFDFGNVWFFTGVGRALFFQIETKEALNSTSRCKNLHMLSTQTTRQMTSANFLQYFSCVLEFPETWKINWNSIQCDCPFAAKSLFIIYISWYFRTRNNGVNGRNGILKKRFYTLTLYLKVWFGMQIYMLLKIWNAKWTEITITKDSGGKYSTFNDFISLLYEKVR